MKTIPEIPKSSASSDESVNNSGKENHGFSKQKVARVFLPQDSENLQEFREIAVEEFFHVRESGNSQKFPIQRER